jgi:hypothetical protein
MLSAIMKAETGITAAVFLSIRNSRAQREALTAAAQVGLKDRELEMFSAIATVYQSLDSQRTDLAHGIFALSDDLPDALLWIDSKHFTQRHIETWSETPSSGLLGQLAQDMESKDKLRNNAFVFRKEDLTSLRDEIREFWGAVIRFTMFLRMPNITIAEEGFQNYIVLVQYSGLSRPREAREIKIRGGRTKSPGQTGTGAKLELGRASPPIQAECSAGVNESCVDKSVPLGNLFSLPGRHCVSRL